MSIQTQPVAVAVTATRLDSTAEGTALSQCMVKNVGTATVYIGGSNVTTANGFPLEIGEAATCDLGRNEALFGIVASGTQNVRVMEVGAA
jgi:hypothetical protein